MLELSISEYRIACMSYKDKTSPRCRKEGPPASTIEIAVSRANADGWQHIENQGSICPECAQANR